MKTFIWTSVIVALGVKSYWVTSLTDPGKAHIYFPLIWAPAIVAVLAACLAIGQLAAKRSSSH